MVIYRLVTPSSYPEPKIEVPRRDCPWDTNSLTPSSRTGLRHAASLSMGLSKR